MSGLIYWLLSTGLCAAGFLGSAAYIAYSYWTRHRSGAAGGELSGDRPWRRRGAAVCALVCVLFHLGLHHVDPARRPRLFLALWIVVLLLVGWLCLLALADMVYTRKQTQQALRRSRRSR